MAEWHVEWATEVEADDPIGAAKAALLMQRDPRSSAVVFDVTPNEGPKPRSSNEVDLLLTENGHLADPMSDLLQHYEVQWEHDLPVLTCTRCNESLCDVEANDGLDVYLRLALGHICAEPST